MNKTIPTTFSVLAASLAFAADSVDFTAAGTRINPMLHSTCFMANLKDHNVGQEPYITDGGFASSETMLWSEGDYNQRVIDLHHIFPLVGQDPSVAANYFFKASDRKLFYANRCNVDVMYRLGSAKESAGYNAQTLVPTNFANTASVMSHVVSHYTASKFAGGIDYSDRITRWEIWSGPDNPDCWWAPDRSPAELRAQFAEFFVTCLRRIKTDHPDVRVGGPALSKWDPEYMGAILDACDAAGVYPDFISYQCYTNDVEGLLAQPAQIRAWLDARGSNYADCEIILSAWHYVPTTSAGYGAGTLDRLDMNNVHEASFGADGTMTAKAAAFNLAVLSGLQRTPLARAYHGASTAFSAFSPFHWSTFNTKVPHVAANAFKLFGTVTKNYTKVLSSQNDGTRSVLGVSNAAGDKGCVLVTDSSSAAGTITVPFSNVKGANNVAAKVVNASNADVQPLSTGVTVTDSGLTIAKAAGAQAYLVTFDISGREMNVWTTPAAITRTKWMVRDDVPGTLTPPVAKFGTWTATLNGAPWDGRTLPTEIGDYTAVWSIPSTAEYTALEATIDFSITEWHAVVDPGIEPGGFLPAIAQFPSDYPAASPCATGGDIVYKDGDDTVFVFTNAAQAATFTPSSNVTARILLVGGGGGGGWNDAGGGGGGGVVEMENVALSAGVAYEVHVGAGGAAATASDAWGVAGGTSSVAGLGGASANGGTGGIGWKGKQATPPADAGGQAGVAGNAKGGHGGKAGSNSPGVDGSNGSVSAILGFDQIFGGGGGGGADGLNKDGSSGGQGGGGQGEGTQSQNRVSATGGEDGLGGGGGGSSGGTGVSSGAAGRGGNGIVIIRVTGGGEGPTLLPNAWTTPAAIFPDSWKTGGTPGMLTVPVAAHNASAMTASLRKDGAAVPGWDGTTLPTAVGSYSIVWTVPSDGVYAQLTTGVSFTITGGKTYVFVGGDTSGKTSFTGSTPANESGWALASAPSTIVSLASLSPEDTFVVSDPDAMNKTVRTPGNGSHTFGGKTLRLDGGWLAFPGENQTITVNDLVSDGGGIVHYASGKTMTLAGNLSVLDEGFKVYVNAGGNGRNFAIASTVTGTGPISFLGSTSSDSTAEYIEFSGDMSGWTGTIVDDPSLSSHMKQLTLKLTGSFGGTVTALPSGTIATVVNYAGLPSGTGLAVASTTLPASFASGLKFYGLADASAADLPLLTFVNGTSLSAEAFTAVKHASTADGAGTAFSNLAVVDGANGAKVLVANHAAEPTHVHDWTGPVLTAAPTCTLDGTNVWTCSGCNLVSNQVVSALGHDWGEWTETKPAAIGEKGEETRTCKREGCGMSETREIPPLPDPDARTYYLVGLDASGKTSFFASSAPGETGWAETPDGTPVAHTVAAGNVYVVPSGTVLRTAGTDAADTFLGSSLTLAGSIAFKKGGNTASPVKTVTIPELIADGGTLDNQYNDVNAFELVGGLEIPGGKTLTIRNQATVSTYARSMKISATAKGSGTLYVSLGGSDPYGAGSVLEFAGDWSGFSGTVAAVSGATKCNSYLLRITGPFGGAIESMPERNNDPSYVFNQGANPRYGIRISATGGLPSCMRYRTCFYNFDPNAANGALFTVPKTLWDEKGSAHFTGLYHAASEADAVAYLRTKSPSADNKLDPTKLSGHDNGDGTVTVVWNYDASTFGADDPAWDIPGETGGINALGEGDGKHVEFSSIAVTASGLTVGLRAAKIDADGETFSLVCKTDLAGDETFVVNATLAAEKDATEGVFTVTADLSGYPQLFIVGVGPAAE